MTFQYSFLSAFLLTATPALACSFILLGSQEEQASAQNFDFPPQVQAGVVVNKRNVEKSDGGFSGAPKAPQAKWISKYGSVTFGFGRESSVTGLNEAGLRVYRFLFLEAKYPPPDSRPAINESQFVQYLLDTAATIGEVIERTKAVQIYALPAPTHFAVCDRKGDCAVIEALNGKLNIYSGPDVKVKAVTNTDFPRSMELFKACPGTQCQDIEDNSDRRFIKAAHQIVNFTGKDLVGGTYDILNSIKQVSPFVETLWTLLSHQGANENKFFVRNTRTSNIVMELDLNKIDFSCKTPVQVALMNPSNGSPSRLTGYNEDFQKVLAETEHNYLGVSEADMQKRITYPSQYTRCLD